MPQLSYNVIISYFQFNANSFPAGSELHYTIASYAVEDKVEDQVKYLTTSQPAAFFPSRSSYNYTRYVL